MDKKPDPSFSPHGVAGHYSPAGIRHHRRWVDLGSNFDGASSSAIGRGPAGGCRGVLFTLSSAHPGSAFWVAGQSDSYSGIAAVRIVVAALVCLRNTSRFGDVEGTPLHTLRTRSSFKGIYSGREF